MLSGPPLRPSVTDGSDAHVLVVRTAAGDRLRGLNVRTGRIGWTRAHPGTSTVRATALVDGVMLLAGRRTLTAIDVRTGSDLWRTAVDPDAAAGALTDGQVALLPVRADDGVLQLVARRIADGTVVWRGGVPSGTVSLTVVDHHLVASTDDEVIGLR
jgi:outer membrane protein assembly factor BamB